MDWMLRDDNTIILFKYSWSIIYYIIWNYI